MRTCSLIAYWILQLPHSCQEWCSVTCPMQVQTMLVQCKMRLSMIASHQKGNKRHRLSLFRAHKELNLYGSRFRIAIGILPPILVFSSIWHINSFLLYRKTFVIMVARLPDRHSGPEQTATCSFSSSCSSWPRRRRTAFSTRHTLRSEVP